MVVTWFTSGIKTIEDAKKKEVPMGATGYNTSSQYVQAMNTIAGTKFKIILGYPGGADINLAMEKGEVAGRGSNSWSSWKATEPDWVRDHKINVLVQIGLSKASDLPDVPLLTDIANDATDRAALKVLSAPPTIGRPIFTSPGVPPERVAALRAAFDAVIKDPDFLEQAQVEQLDINPVSGAELQKIVADILSTPKATIDRLSAIITLPEQATFGEEIASAGLRVLRVFVVVNEPRRPKDHANMGGSYRFSPVGGVTASASSSAATRLRS